MGSGEGEVGPEFDELSGGRVTKAQVAFIKREQGRARLRLAFQAIAFIVAIVFVGFLTYFFYTVHWSADVPVGNRQSRGN